jgi:hypothetical protein
MVRASHFFATSTVIADALTVIDPTATQTNTAPRLRDFGLANMLYLPPVVMGRPHWLAGLDLLAKQKAPSRRAECL